MYRKTLEFRKRRSLLGQGDEQREFCRVSYRCISDPNEEKTRIESRLAAISRDSNFTDFCLHILGEVGISYVMCSTI